MCEPRQCLGTYYYATSTDDSLQIFDQILCEIIELIVPLASRDGHAPEAKQTRRELLCKKKSYVARKLCLNCDYHETRGKKIKSASAFD